MEDDDAGVTAAMVISSWVKRHQRKIQLQIGIQLQAEILHAYG